MSRHVAPGLVGAWGGFALLLVCVGSAQLRAFDTYLAAAIEAPHDCRVLSVSEAVALPFSAEGSLVLLTLGMLLSIRSRSRRWWVLPGLLGLSVAIELAVKLLVPQPEPAQPVWPAIAGCPPSSQTLVNVSVGNSFPSGHVIRAAYLCGLLLAAIRERMTQVRIGTVVCIVLLVLGWARVYCSAHWPTDVLGGLLLGTALALSSARLRPTPP